MGMYSGVEPIEMADSQIRQSEYPELAEEIPYWDQTPAKIDIVLFVALPIIASFSLIVWSVLS